MSIPTWDLVAAGNALVVGAHVRKLKFNENVSVKLGQLLDVQASAFQLYSMTDIDASEGVQLDVLGRLLGQPRRLEQAIPRAFFGWEPEIGGFQLALPFGEVDSSTIGGPWSEIGGSTSDSALMDDAMYRLALKARIVYNNARVDGDAAPVETLYKVLRLILPDSYLIALTGTEEFFEPTYPVVCEDFGGMHVTIEIGKIPTPRERALLLFAGLLPILAGVEWSIGVWDSTGLVFGFEETPNSAPFGEIGDAVTGAMWAEVLA